MPARVEDGLEDDGGGGGVEFTTLAAVGAGNGAGRFDRAEPFVADGHGDGEALAKGRGEEADLLRLGRIGAGEADGKAEDHFGGNGGLDSGDDILSGREHDRVPRMGEHTEFIADGEADAFAAGVNGQQLGERT